MLTLELFEELEGPPEPTLIDALRDFLPIAVKHLKIKKLPKIKLLREVDTEHMASFGKFSNEDRIVHVDIQNRHPNDVLRTLAHELTHYAQGEQDRLDADSWRTGSTIEDEANAEAGVIMREFNKQFPEYMELKPIILPEAWSQKYKKSINCSNPKGFSQRAHCQGRKKNNESADYERDMQSDPSDPIPFPPGTTLVNVSDVYDWYKLGMAVPALDKADPRIFNKGVPHTVFAFGTEEEEHRMVPLLKRLGFTLHDIDRPEDYAKAIRASDVVEHLEQYVAENFADKVEESAKTPNKVITSDGITVKFFNNVKAFYKGHELIWAKEGNYSNPTEHDIHVAKITTSRLAADMGRKKIGMDENFADGKGPGRPGDSQRHGIPKGATMAQLEKAAKAPGRKGQLARWQINMRRGRKK